MREELTRHSRRSTRGGGLAVAIATLVLTFVAREASADGWSPTSTMGAPSPRQSHTTVWTGSKMIVWGGLGSASVGNTNTGGVYDPATDTWTPVSTTGAPTRRDAHTAVWTGSRMIVWGGLASGSIVDTVNTGGIYDPATDTWTPMSTTNAPSARSGHKAVWTGSKMIVWGGGWMLGRLNTGGIYDPATDTWTATSTTGAPLARTGHTAVWTGSRMIVWGGGTGLVTFPPGGIYDPTTDTWIATSAADGISRFGHSAVWTGSRMIVWGGSGSGGYMNSGVVYDPATDTWTAVSTTGGPPVRYNHTAVWTGSRMIVWGGYNGSIALNTGGNYDVATDSWISTSTTGAPSARYQHTAVWTGSKMLVWGSSDSNTGGIYDPSDVRSATTTVLTSSVNPSTTGQGVTFTATLTSSGGTPTGSVAFLDGSLPLGSYILSGGVAATSPITSLTVGSHLIVANYLGDPGFLTSSSALTQVVLGDDAGISTSSASTAEGNSGAKDLVFRVSLSTPIAQTVTVQVATQDGTATAGSDYVATSTTLTFTPGVTSQLFVVSITGDALDEPDETFFVNLSNPVNATLATTQVMGVILTDDPGTNPSTLDQVFTPVTPCRFVDGINANDKVPAPANGTVARYYRVRGSTSSDFVSQGAASSAPNGCGVPDSATAIMVNLTVADPTNDGDIRVDASHFATPSQTSLLNYTFGGARFKNLANGVIVPLCNRSVSSCASGANPTSPIRDILVTFHAGASAVSTYFLADVLGYFSPAPLTNLATIGCGNGTVFAELAAAQCPAGAGRGTPVCSQVAAGFPCAFGAAACSGATVYKNDGVTLSAFSTSLDNCTGGTDWYIRLK
jgi:N-acetylneuraminic acid mutarotase